MSEWHPRLSVELTEDQYRRLGKIIPWGIKRKLFSVLVDDVIRCAEEHGQKFLSALLNRAIKIEDYSVIGKDLRNGDNKQSP